MAIPPDELDLRQPELPVIPFNRPFVSGNELSYIQEAIAGGHLSGNGPFAQRCQSWLEREMGCGKALLTHSCTGALEMAAILAGIEPGDEVVMPSFTFVSTANAFVLRGGVPVFVDVCEATLTIDPVLAEAAITARTKAVVPVHYAGIAADMDALRSIAERRHILLIEDAAQAVGSTHRGRPLGSLGDLAAVSFHETKSIMCGEGGALLINCQDWEDQAETIWEKGTNRSRFFRGEVDRYSWIGIGSSFQPGELIAAFLWAQIESAERILQLRLAIWSLYHHMLEPLEREGILQRPAVRSGCQHNGHLYYVLLPDLSVRTRVLSMLARDGINAVFHYVPLHSSIAGRQYGRTHGTLPVTEKVSDCLIRLPLWVGMGEREVSRVVERLSVALTR